MHRLKDSKRQPTDAELFNEHGELVDKMFDSGLTTDERARLEYVRRELDDRIAKHGEELLDVL